jgi:dTDP-4-amino-4,6-dideoxygalactose transaminase
VTTKAPLISILMPCSARPYLMVARSIPSVLAQSYERWELVVVSESQENAAAAQAVDGFGDKRIHYYEMQRPDTGAMNSEQPMHAARAAARNFAESQAGGDIIALLDDDDAFEPGHLAECVAALEETGADLVYGDVHVIDPNTGAMEARDHLPWHETESRQRFLSRDIFAAASVAYLGKWREHPYPESPTLTAGYGKWMAMHHAGAKFTSIEKVQATHYLSPTRVSMPTLPPLPDCLAAVQEISRTRQASNYGPYCRSLEERVAQRLGTEHVVAAASGDTALGMAMRLVAERDQSRDEVIVPSYTFASTVNAVLRAGLKPVFCDVEPVSLCATVETMRACASSATVAILPVHTHGIPCDMPALEKLAAELDVLLVSDAAAGLGATIGNRPVGSFGDIEMFSLSATKVLTAGEGGLLACRDESLADALRELGRYGLGDHYNMAHAAGYNGRLPEFSAAVALASLPHLDRWLVLRRRSAALYRQALEGSGLVMIRPAAATFEPTWKDVPFLVPTAAICTRLQHRLAGYGIETRPYYRPLHRMPPLAGHARGDLRVTDDIADRVLCLPVTNEIPDDTVRFVAATAAYELASALTAER